QKVGQALAGPKARVTFVVVENRQARIESYLGGWVVVSTGALSQLGNEADLAAALAHQIGHIAAKDPLNDYAKARFTTCKTSMTGMSLVAAGAIGIPGTEAFVKGSAFAKSQEALAAEDLAQALKAPGVDAGGVVSMLRQGLGMQRLARGMEPELKADDAAFAMLSAGGYDGMALRRTAGLEGMSITAEREASFAKKQRRGRVPPIPAELKWPKP
ncbi:MAG: M48 family metalloprotease, partial [Myxococcaceae bacterium]|nr:M48 family metalloprotease [Myxococcaceae bacterium]